MKFINKVKIDIPAVNQEFELGDLTIFIGRANCGKTRVLKEINNKMINTGGFFKKDVPFHLIQKNVEKIGVELGDVIDKVTPLLISSPRPIVGKIDTYTEGFNNIQKSSNKMDPTIDDFGNHGVMQDGKHRNLDIQGSGIQNLVQIFAKTHQEENFILLDEPEISQFPIGKIEILTRIIDILHNKQVLLATHDPTLINQYLIKRIMKDEKFKIVIYSFCEGRFEKIDFVSDLDPEIHCGYLSQTFSAKPIHLVFEGQTEFYTFQALLHKYCLNKKVHNFPKIINKINLSHLAGKQWRIPR